MVLSIGVENSINLIPARAHSLRVVGSMEQSSSHQTEVANMRMRMDKQSRDSLDICIILAVVTAYLQWNKMREHIASAKEPSITATTLVKCDGLGWQAKSNSIKVHFPSMDAYTKDPDAQWVQDWSNLQDSEKVTLVNRRLKALTKRGILIASWGCNWNGKESRLYEPGTDAKLAVAAYDFARGCSRMQFDCLL